MVVDSDVPALWRASVIHICVACKLGATWLMCKSWHVTYKVLCEYLVRSMSCFKPPRCVNPRISTCRIRTFSTLPFTFFQCVVFLFRAEGNTTLYMSQTKRKFFNAECYHNSNVQSSNTAQNPLPSNTLGITTTLLQIAWLKMHKPQPYSFPLCHIPFLHRKSQTLGYSMLCKQTSIPHILWDRQLTLLSRVRFLAEAVKGISWNEHLCLVST